MCITDTRTILRAVILRLALRAWPVLLLASTLSSGHPVAQGSLDIVLQPERVLIRANVSTEEVLVAAAYGGDGELTLQTKIARHADYLRAHLFVAADGAVLSAASAVGDARGVR